MKACIRCIFALFFVFFFKWQEVKINLFIMSVVGSDVMSHHMYSISHPVTSHRIMQHPITKFLIMSHCTEGVLTGLRHHGGVHLGIDRPHGWGK